jgi:hypothetical protein
MVFCYEDGATGWQISKRQKHATAKARRSGRKARFCPLTTATRWCFPTSRRSQLDHGCGWRPAERPRQSLRNPKVFKDAGAKDLQTRFSAPTMMPGFADAGLCSYRL